jgi:hypothetical protein
MGSAELVRSTGDVSGVVPAMARLVMPVGEDSQGALGVSSYDFGPCTCGMKRLLASVKFQVEALHLYAAETLGAGVAAAVAFMDCGLIRGLFCVDTNQLLTLRVALVFVLFLVLLVATVAFGVMGLGLARTATVLALLDRTTLGVDMEQWAICEDVVLVDMMPRLALWRKSVPSWVHPLTRWPLMHELHAHFSPFLIGMPEPNTAESGRRTWRDAVR